MDQLRFEYVTYVSTSPKTLWNALLNGKITKQYWQWKQSRRRAPYAELDINRHMWSAGLC